MRVPCCALLVLAAAGCGDADYRRDFAENTLPYYSQRQALDVALNAPWEKAGISLRVPKSFSEQLGPPPPTKEQKEDEFWEPPPDKRQPDYLLDRLPGLRGAWKGPLPGAGEQAGNRWLYVLDSAALKDDPVDSGMDPAQFAFEVTDRFARALNVERSDYPEEFKEVTFPRTPQRFARPVQYRSPRIPLMGKFSDRDELVHVADIFVHEAGARTVIVAMVMPEGAMRRPAISEPRDLMLQTLEVGAARAAAPPAGGGGGTGGVGF